MKIKFKKATSSSFTLSVIAASLLGSFNTAYAHDHSTATASGDDPEVHDSLTVYENED